MRLTGFLRWWIGHGFRALNVLYAAPAVRPGYPPVVLFRCLLLQQWYGLSDMALEAQLGCDLVFHRFSGLSLEDAVPDHSTLLRFRTALMNRKLAEKLFTEETDSRKLPS